MMGIKQKSIKDKVALEGGRTLMHVEFDVPVDIIIKHDPANLGGTYGWKIIYKDKAWGHYVDMRGMQGSFEDLYASSMEYAERVFVQQVLLTDAPSEFLIDEIVDRLGQKFFPIWMYTKRKYCTKDVDGKREWRLKWSLRYMYWKTRIFIIYSLLKVVLNLLKEEDGKQKTNNQRRGFFTTEF